MAAAKKSISSTTNPKNSLLDVAADLISGSGLDLETVLDAAAGAATKKEIEKAQAVAAARNRAMFELASDLEISPYTDYNEHPDFIENFMFSNEEAPKLSDDKPDVWLKKE